MPLISLRRRCMVASLYIALALLSAPLTAVAVTLDVSVDGLSGEVKNNVLAALGIYQERDREDLTPTRVRRLHRAAPEEIRAAMQPFGFYRTQIDAMLDETDETWTARYRITPGPRVPVTSVDLYITGDGADDEAFQTFVEQFPLARGDALDHGAYESAKRRFQTIAAERGYFDFRFTRGEIRLDLDAYRADMHLHVDTGGRYRFGEIMIDETVLDPELIARYVRIQPDAPYSTAALLEAQNALTNSGYFSQVTVDADPQQATDRTVPVQVQLTLRKQNRYTFGAGYGTDTGPRGQIGWERYYLNPQGHNTRVELRASEIERSFTAGYFIPIRNPRTDRLAFTGGYEETDTITAETQTRRLAVSRTSVRGSTFETLSVTHLREAFDFGDQERTTSLLLPGVNWTYYWGEDRIYTRRGARALLDMRGAHEDFIADISLFQVRFQAKVILPVSTFGRLIARGEIGTIQTDTFEQVPASLRFFAGGDVSVRGYAFNSLGPTDAQGDIVGGRRLLVGSVEYEQRVTGNWAAAVFYDAGNALNDFSDPLAEGAGFGVRWRSPIGQIRLDVARALSDPDPSWRIHLYIGPDL